MSNHSDCKINCGSTDCNARVVVRKDQHINAGRYAGTYDPPKPRTTTTLTPIAEDELRALIERECGPVQRISDMWWAVEVARAVERAHGIAGANILIGASSGEKK